MAAQICTQCNGRKATFVAAQAVFDRFGNAAGNVPNLQAQGLTLCQQCNGTGLLSGHNPG